MRRRKQQQFSRENCARSSTRSEEGGAGLSARTSACAAGGRLSPPQTWTHGPARAHPQQQHRTPGPRRVRRQRPGKLFVTSCHSFRECTGCRRAPGARRRGPRSQTGGLPNTEQPQNQVFRKFAFQISWRTEEIPYSLDVDWPKYSEYFTGATFCVAVDSLNGLVYVAQRGDNIPKVLVFTEDGYLLRSWNYTVDTPHGIFAASTQHEQSLWITDVGSGSYGHTIKKYNSFGDLVQVLGTPGKKGTGLNPLQFDNPAELYVEDTGDIYIVDGDGGLNNRLIKLSQDFMMLWLRGENGTGPAKFNIPHSVTVDSTGRVWVADRGNKRIQVFDKDTGEWLGAWNNCFTEEGPSSVRFTPDGKYLVIAQLNLSRLLFVAAPPAGGIGDCSVISTIQLADQVLPHLLDISGKTGAIYVAEIGAKQVQKYVPFNNYFSSSGS